MTGWPWKSKPHRHVKEKDRQWDKDYQTYEELKVSACHQCIEQGGNVEDAKLWMGFLHLQWGTFSSEWNAHQGDKLFRRCHMW
ncbi:hypothetical protein DPMN_119464 [Dreissena polymorpha]|uniref:Uncharacterized protein n=1 Tax=Dreissena polymorpha TaxID=45954 RepID=A0A9D4JRA4_DREPO|nr:hypothetical protein DPMN_119464 [Dreissena polymorpha]